MQMRGTAAGWENKRRGKKYNNNNNNKERVAGMSTHLNTNTGRAYVMQIKMPRRARGERERRLRAAAMSLPTVFLFMLFFTCPRVILFEKPRGRLNRMNEYGKNPVR